jgi:uncharacterized membrane protein
MEAIKYIIVATIFYSLFQIFSGQSSGKIDANLSASIFNGIGAMIPLVVYLIYNMIRNHESVPTTSKGIVYSVIAGLAIAVFSIALVKSFEKGANISFVIPLVYGGSIVLTSIISNFWLSEKISNWHLIGLGLIAAGFVTIIISKAMLETK